MRRLAGKIDDVRPVHSSTATPSPASVRRVIPSVEQLPRVWCHSRIVAVRTFIPVHPAVQYVCAGVSPDINASTVLPLIASNHTVLDKRASLVVKAVLTVVPTTRHRPRFCQCANNYSFNGFRRLAHRCKNYV